MNNLDKQYLDLLKDIRDNGVIKETRNGKVRSVFGRQIRHKMSEGFPILTTKKVAWKQVVTELLWFLRGESNIQSLVKDGNYIWVGDSYKDYKNRVKFSSNAYDRHYKLVNTNENGIGEFEIGDDFSREEFIEKIKTDDKFAKDWGDCRKIYGYQWRSWNGEIDQIQNLIDTLKSNPDDRRMLVTAWNPSDKDEQLLPPCHYGFQVYTRELSLEERSIIWNDTHNPSGNIYTHKQYDENEIPARAISLSWQQRSVDTPLGLPFNIASYGLLLEIIAKEVNMVPDELIGNLGDTHIYENQLDGVEEQLGREPRALPRLTLDYREGEYNHNLKEFVYDDYVLLDYNPHPKIYFPLSN